jgi:hypothetical protein
MKLINEHTLAKEVALGWANLAAPNSTEGERNINILEKIAVAKIENPDPDEVARISGDNGLLWTVCNECEKEMIPVVELGEEYYYDSSTATICRECLEKALALISGD